MRGKGRIDEKMEIWVTGRKGMRGSYTAEAAFLVPLGFILMVLILSYGFICYDRVVLCAGIHGAAQREGFQKWKEEDGEKENEEMLPSVFMSSVKAEKTEEELLVTGRGRGKFLSEAVKPIFFLEEPVYDNRESVRLIYGEDVVRKCIFEGADAGGSAL